MISMIQLLILQQCGGLSFICCLSRDQLGTLAKWTQDMTTGDLDQLYKLACLCQPSGGGGGQPQPQPQPTPQPQPQGGGGGGGTGGTDSALGLACAKNLMNTICTPPGSTLILSVKEAVDIVLLGDPDPTTKTLLLVLAVGLELLEGACLEQDIAMDTVVGLCKVFNFMSGVAQGVLPDAITSFWQTSTVGQALSACCSDPTVQSGETPDWAAVIGAPA